MVRPWEEARKKGIKITKYRIAHLEKHGNGDTVMKEKYILKKQERHHKLQEDKLNASS